MEHQAFLATISEIAVAYVGFTGIVAAFRYRSDRWTADERTQFTVMLRAAVSALFMSLLPYLLDAYLADPALVWRVATGLVALIMISNLYASIRGGARLLRVHWLHGFLFPGGVLVMLLNLIAFAGFLPADKMVLTSLVWQLLIATHNFISLILGKPDSVVSEQNKDPEPASPAQE